MSVATKAKIEPGRLLIDGRWVDGSKTFDTINPATGEVLTQVAEASAAEVDHAVTAARRAFEGPWRTMRAAERGHILLRLVDLMKKHADEIAALESLDAGKPISGVLRQDLPAAIDTLTYYAGWADKISGECRLSIDMPICPSICDCDILAFNNSILIQASPKCSYEICETGSRLPVQEANDGLRLLLRGFWNRRCDCLMSAS